MPEYSGFFGAKLMEDGTYDRMYSDKHFAKLFSMFYRNGIFLDKSYSLKVFAKSGLTVTVKAGRAFIDGYWYELDEDMDVVLDSNTTSNTIRCTIVCALNKAERKISVVKNQPITTLLPKDDSNIHELVLAGIKLGVGVNSITDSVITDYRLDKKYCGVVTGAIEQIDAGGFFSQLESQFLEWFEEMKGILSEDVAGNLAVSLNDVKSILSELQSYATEKEVVIGKWKDKKLYRKCFEHRVKISRRGSFDSGITYSNIDKVVRLYAVSNSKEGKVPTYYNDSDDFFRVWLSADGRINFETGDSFPPLNHDITVIMEYTKIES